ncbi:ATP-binding protein [Arundinibacter roseus]|uniref:ATPase AAA-type core domain-containing protein n=1 Tax=Arundinibacter roseus TaxID=2070510 RepID=A0A4R4KGR7_9BACT|nr:ATP-binding protein [Arundinibacter roseus]TDB66933.1 hypothetical protein EZE20_07370 [Arundinibacter roseus]
MNTTSTDNTPVYFSSIELKNIRGFKERSTLNLTKDDGSWAKWTVILGDNGTGKTTLLQCLSLLETAYFKTNNFGNEDIYKGPIRLFNGYFLNNKDDFRLALNNEPSAIKSNLFYKNKKNSNQIKIDNIHSIDEALTDIDLWFSLENNQIKLRGDFQFSNNQLIVYAYGASRGISSTNLSESQSQNNETLFSPDATLLNAEEWLLRLDYAASKESSIKNRATRQRELVKDMLINLLPEVEDIRFNLPSLSNYTPIVEFKVSLGWVTIKQLSIGYKSMVSWMVDLAARLFLRYPDSENPLAEPAIVLIDEIDLHLHPKWQRDIFSYLSERFPNTQFIVTAHSPLIVQSAPQDANIVVLRKEEEGVVIDSNVESVRKWRIDQILTSDLFGLESARSPDIEMQLKERELLLKKNNLDSREQERLNYLNNIAHGLPTGFSDTDRQAFDLIHQAAAFLKNKKDD